MELKINRVHIESLHGIRYAFYFTLVKVEGKWRSYVSHHKCEGMSEKEAQTAFTREHFEEVETLVMQQMKNEILNN